MPESLNLYYNRQLLIIKAMSKYKLQKDAAKALGISERTLINYKKIYKID